jgi:hypothetical protein
MEDLHIQHHNLPATTIRVLSTKRQITTIKTQHYSRNIQIHTQKTKRKLLKSRAKRPYRKWQDLALSSFNHKLLHSFRAVPGKMTARKTN